MSILNTLENHLARLRYRSKFLLLGLSTSLVVIVMATVILRQQANDITATQQELKGLALYRLISPAFFDLMRHRGLAVRLASGDLSALADFNSTSRDIDEKLQAILTFNATVPALAEEQPHWQALQDNWQSLRAVPVSGTGAEAMEKHNKLIEDMEEHMLDTLDGTGITLEPEASAYYGLAVATTNLPRAAGLYGLLRAQGAATFSSDADTARHALSALPGLIGAARMATSDMMGSADRFNQYNPGFASQQRDKVEALRVQSEQFLQSAEQLYQQQNAPSQADYFHQASTLIDRMESLQLDTYMTEVERLLNQRLTRLEHEQEWLVAITVLVIVSLLLIFVLTARLINRTVSNLQTVSSQWQQGNLASQVPVIGDDELAQASQSLNRAMTTVAEMVATLKSTAADMVQQVEQLAAASVQVLADSEAQSESASSMAASIEEMSASISLITTNSVHAEQTSRQSANTAQQVNGMVSTSVGSMQAIAGQVTTASQRIAEMGEKSDQISAIIATIRSIADQTNLLALNAAIEAARAGEQGRGFSVVADEVRTLAARTSDATDQIARTILTVVEDTRRIADEMAASKTGVDDGVKRILEVGTAMNAIHNDSEELIHATHDIHAALREQDAATQDVAHKIELVASRAEESRAAVEQLNDIAARLRNASRELVSASGRFST